MGLMQMFVKLGLDASSYETGLKQAGQKAEEFGHGLEHGLKEKIVEAFSVAGALEVFRETVEWAEKLSHISARTGIPLDELQSMEYLAKKANLELDTLTGSYEKLGKTMAKARAGGQGSDAFESLRRLGVSDENIQGGSAEDIAQAFAAISEHIRTGARDAQNMKDLIEAMGKGANQLVPAMKEGLGSEEQRAWAASLVVSVDKMSALKYIADELKTIWAIIASGSKSAAGSVAEMVVGLTAAVKIGASTVGGFLLGAVKGHPFEKAGEAFHEAVQGQKERIEEGMKKPEGIPAEQEEAHKQEKKNQLEKEAKQREHDTNEIIRLHREAAAIREQTAMEELTEEAKARLLEKQLNMLRLHKENQEKLDLPIEAAQTDVEMARKEKELERAKQNIEKARLKGEKAEPLLRGSSDSLISAGNYLGRDPGRETNERLDVLHEDLRTIIRQTGGSKESLGGSKYPS